MVPRGVQFGLGLAFLAAVAGVAGLLIYSSSTVIDRRASVDRLVTELAAWRRTVPGLEGVDIRRADVGAAFIILEGEAATDADYEALLDRIASTEDVEFRVMVTVRSKESP